MKVIKKLIMCIFFIGLFYFALIFGKGYGMYKESVDKMPIENKIEEIRNSEDFVKIDDVPDIYLNAVIAVEDHRFYNHCGIDLIAITRAIFNDIRYMKFVEGGSTITQQIAKNVYFTQEKKLTRKIAEVFVSLDIEKIYEKKEILEIYINTIYFGNGYYNLKDASMGYFNKLPCDMSDYECIMLAGIPNAPSVYSPFNNLELTKQRQKQVIDKMVKYKYLSKKEANSIILERVIIANCLLLC